MGGTTSRHTFVWCVCLLAAACTRSAPEAKAPVSGVTLVHRVLSAPADRVAALAPLAPGPERHVVVMLRTPVPPPGVTLVHPLGGLAFTARVPAGVDARTPDVVAAFELLPLDKAHPGLATPPPHAVETGGLTRVVVLLWPGNNAAQVAARLRQRGVDVFSVVAEQDQLHARVEQHALDVLLEDTSVQWVEPAPPAPTSEMPRALAAVHQPQVLAAPFGLTGAGVKVSIHDNGHAFPHADFAPRYLRGDADAGQAANVQLHPTMTTGTVGGAGVLDGGVPGMATQAQLLGYDFTSTPCCLANQQQDVTNAARNAVAVSNNSWGYADCAVAAYGAYTAESAGYDQVALGNGDGGTPPLLMVFSAGNERRGIGGDTARQACIPNKSPPYANYGTVNQPKAAKNVLVVGSVDSATNAMSSFSGWGPVVDGRLKPELVAPGLHNGAVLDGGVSDVTNCFGTPTGAANQQCYRATNTSNTAFGGYAWFSATSASAALVSGGVALLTQQWRALQVPVTSENPPPSFMRALLTHTALDLADATPWFHPGPDYASGYGLVDVQQAATRLAAGPILQDCVGQGAVKHFFLPSSLVTTPLKATLAWDDPPGAPLAAGPNLVHDLDLRVFTADGTRIFPWTLNPAQPDAPAVQTQEDHLNNLEQVMAAPSATPGLWRVDVVGTAVTAPSQCFTLVLSPVLAADADNDGVPLPLDCDDGNNVVFPGAPQRCDAVNNDCNDPSWPACPNGDCATHCNDNSACTTSDHCVAGACVGDALPCDDGNECTANTCDALLGCAFTNVPEGTACNDATVCNGAESCQAGTCTPGTPLSCVDQNPCTTEACDPVLGCVFPAVMDGTPCLDATVCNGAEYCVAGACVAGTPLSCDDGNLCTAETCDAVLGCNSSAVMDGTPCLDGDVCNGAEQCVSGTCTNGAPLVCGDQNACTVESCDAVNGCISSPVMDGMPCPDGDVCNGDETCQGGNCSAGTPGACVDAGTPDAAVALDAAVTSDAGVPSDAGVALDAALPQDAAVTSDAAMTSDAAVASDAAMTLDAAVRLDASAVGDAGIPQDAGQGRDASAPRDAAVPVTGDAGAQAGVDAAAQEGPQDPPGRCACATPANRGAPWAALGLAGVLAAWRKRSGRRIQKR